MHYMEEPAHIPFCIDRIISFFSRPHKLSFISDRNKKNENDIKQNQPDHTQEYDPDYL